MSLSCKKDEKKSELTRRINDKKMDIRKDKVKLKDMYQRYFQDPESAFEKGILLPDAFARLYYINFQVEDQFFHTSLTEPEINYIKQSGKIKYMWLKIEEAKEIKDHEKLYLIWEPAGHFVVQRRLFFSR